MKKLKKWMMEQSQLVSCLIKLAVHMSTKLTIADQTLGGVHQLVQSLQSHLLLSWLVHRKRCSADQPSQKS